MKTKTINYEQCRELLNIGMALGGDEGKKIIATADIETMMLSEVMELEDMVQGIIDKVQASDPTAVAIKPIADFLGLERADTTDQ